MKKTLTIVATLVLLSTNAFAADTAKDEVKADLKKLMKLEMTIQKPQLK